MDPSTPATVAIKRAREVHRAVHEAAELALRRLARQYVREQSFRTRLFAEVAWVIYAETSAEHVGDRALARR